MKKEKPKTLNKKLLEEKIPKMYATKCAEFFKVSYPTIKKLAAELGLSFLEYKPNGRKKIKLK